MPKVPRSELLKLARSLDINLPENEFARLLDRAREDPDPLEYIRRFASCPPIDPPPAAEESAAAAPVCSDVDPEPEHSDTVKAYLAKRRQLDDLFRETAAGWPDNRPLPHWTEEPIRETIWGWDLEALATLDESRLTDEQISNELRRHLRLNALRPQIGSLAEIDAAEERKEQADAVLNREGPALREQIAKLTARLQELESAARSASADLDRRGQALQLFREDAVPHYLQLRQPLDLAPLTAQRNEAREEARCRELLLQRKPDDRQDRGCIEDWVLVYHPELVRVETYTDPADPDHILKQTIIDLSTWDKLRPEVERQREHYQRQADELQRQLDRRLRGLEALQRRTVDEFVERMLGGHPTEQAAAV
jgi:hypothetical protein